MQKREAVITANVLISLIDRKKIGASQLTMRNSQFEADAYNVQCQIALEKGTEESTERAVISFENQLEVNEQLAMLMVLPL